MARPTFYILYILFFVQYSWAQNPFAHWLKQSPKNNSIFYSQEAPFRLPFTYAKTIFQKQLHLNQVVADLGPDALSSWEKIYSELPFVDQLWLYAFPFPIQRNWEILPYPFINDLQSTKPSQWIKEFERPARERHPLKSLTFHKKLDSLTGSELYAGNKLELLKTPHSYQKLLEKIGEAKSHVLLTTFLFQCDQGSEPLLQLMKKKSEEGVKFYLIVDKLFTLTNKSCLEKIRSTKAKLALHGASGIGKIFHEKMAIIDGEYGIIDGQNIVGSQTLSNGTNNLLNDIGVGVKGPIVTLMAQRFLRHWQKVLKEDIAPEITRFYKNKSKTLIDHRASKTLQQSLDQEEGVCRLVGKEPNKNDLNILNLYLESIKTSEKYLFFNFIDLVFNQMHGKTIGEIFLSAVIEQLNKTPQMRADMLTNTLRGPADYRLPYVGTIKHNLFSRTILFLGELTTKKPYEVGPKIKHNFNQLIVHGNLHWWSYAQYMHAKTLMVDNIWTIVGSYNLNNASQDNSYELVLACLDKKLAQQMQASIVTDAINSISILYKE